MQPDHLSTGTNVLDALLDGGYDKDIITTIYGPGGSGKTNLCLICAINTARSGKKVIYVDTEGVSSERMRQLSKDTSFFEHIIFFKPISFEEQKRAFSELKEIVDHKVGLIVIDTIAMLYRLEIGKTDDIYTVNRELGLQLSSLTEIARIKKIPIVITNQVYSDFEHKDQVNMVGGDILKYASKCLIELQKAKSNIRVAIVKKHRSIPEEKKILFEIVSDGIKEFN